MTARSPGMRERLRPLGRSFFGLLAGFCLILVLSVFGYATLMIVLPRHFTAGGDPVTPTSYAAIVAYTSVFSFLGAVVTTRLARRAVMLHALVLGGMEAATLLSTTQTTGVGAPPWFATTLVALSVAAILLAGWRESRRFRASG